MEEQDCSFQSGWANEEPPACIGKDFTKMKLTSKLLVSLHLRLRPSTERAFVLAALGIKSTSLVRI